MAGLGWFGGDDGVGEFFDVGDDVSAGFFQ
jgi:hypothetical protein